MSDKLSDLIQVRLNATDRLGLNSIARRASAHVYGEWKERAEALEQRVEELEDALEHCGYDATDCIDCGGPPHNEWCRFWKLRDFVPALFALAADDDLDKLTTQQKPTEEAMEEA